MKSLNIAAKFVIRHGKILLKGFLRMMYGTLTAGLFAFAVYGFTKITAESGWVAVLEFLASVCVAVLGAILMYAQGVDVKKGVKR